MRPPSPSPRLAPAISAVPLLWALLWALAGSALAQDGVPRNPPTPPQAPIVAPRVAPARPPCPPGATSRVCHASRVTLRPAQPPPPRQLGRTDDITGSRFVPPAIQRFLADPRLAPTTRAFLRGVAAKPTEDWTLREYEMVTQLVPTLTEMAISTRTLSDFYEFLGLDPTQLFEPKLGKFQTSTGFDQRNYDAVQQAQCLYLLGYGENLDPSSVLLKDLAACAPAANSH